MARREPEERLGRWVRVLLGPLPATLLLLPMILAGALGAAMSLGAALLTPSRANAERWSDVTSTGLLIVWVIAAGAGLLALWILVLSDRAVSTRPPLVRWALGTGLLLGILAASRWLWLMAASRAHYDLHTWVVWLLMLVGPIVLAIYYLLCVVRGRPGAEDR